ncbi:MAG: hypothetical protein ACLFVY_12010 [Phycisphaerae bacterium]
MFQDESIDDSSNHEPTPDQPATEPTFPAAGQENAEEVDLESWDWPGQEQTRSPAETLDGQDVPASDDGLIPLADETPAYQLTEAPPQDGFTVPDELAAPKATGTRRLMHYVAAVVMLGGLALGVRLGWNQMRNALGDLEDHVSYLREKGNETPEHRKLVEERLNDPTRRSVEAAQGKDDNPGKATSTDQHQDGGGKSTVGRLMDLVKAGRSGKEKASDAHSGAPGQAHSKPASPVRDESADARSRDGYTLQAIVNGPGGNLAMINGKCVRIGQRVDGATLKRVTSNSVTLEKDGRTIHLKW